MGDRPTGRKSLGQETPVRPRSTRCSYQQVNRPDLLSNGGWGGLRLRSTFSSLLCVVLGSSQVEVMERQDDDHRTQPSDPQPACFC